MNTQDLAEQKTYLTLDQNKVAIADVDTRALVKYIREHGAQNAVLTTEVNRLDELKEELKDYPSMVGRELASTVSTKEPYFFGDESAPIKVAALDLGVKKYSSKYR